MSLNIVKRIKGPAVVSFKQASFFSQDDIVINLSPTLFDVQSSAYGVVSQRIDDYQAACQFTPLGIPSAAIFDIYNRIAAKPLNAFMADSWRISAVDHATNNTLAIAAHGIANGTPARIFSIEGAVPGGLDETTLYYTRAYDAGNITLHATQAAALAGTGAIDLTSAGTGKLGLVEQQPLRIQSLDTGEYIEFHNAVVSGLPPLTFGATAQLFGQMSFAMFPKFGVARSTADSVFSEGVAAVTASLDPSLIITQPYLGQWGSAPWDSFETETGFTMQIQLQTSNDQADSIGTGMISLQSLSVQVQGQPIGISESALVAALKIQGSGAVRGGLLGGEDLNIVGTGVYARLYNALLNSGGLTYGATNPRINQLTWQASRTVTAGVADPLFYLGSAAPV